MHLDVTLENRRLVFERRHNKAFRVVDVQNGVEEEAVEPTPNVETAFVEI